MGIAGEIVYLNIELAYTIMATEGQVTCIREGKVRFFKRQIKNKISFLAGDE